MIYILCIFLIALILWLYYIISKKVVITSFHISNLFFIICVVVFVLLIITYPKVSFSSASSGVNLWFNIVLPSQLPFFIGSELLIGLGFVNFIGTLLEPFMRYIFNVPGSGAFALAMGLSSGYPTGAKITTSLREKNLCSKTEAERLLTFTNNSGPLFIIGAVSVGMFNDPKLGIILAVAHYTAAITVGIMFRFYKRKEISNDEVSHFQGSIFRKAAQEMFRARRNDGRSFGIMLGDSIKNSVNLVLMIGGFIILFSVIISLLSELQILSFFTYYLGLFLKPLGIDSSVINSVLSGIFEITTGCRLASIAPTDYIAKICAAAFILGWAGLSVHLQVVSIIGKTDISPVPYLYAKFMQGIIAAAYTYILYVTFLASQTTSVFNNHLHSHIPWVGYFVMSSKLLLIMFLAMLSISIFSSLIGYLKR